MSNNPNVPNQTPPTPAPLPPQVPPQTAQPTSQAAPQVPAPQAPAPRTPAPQVPAPQIPALPLFALSQSDSYFLQKHFDQNVAAFAACQNLTTGYKILDRQQPFYPGFYCLGAISSLGKTTFAQQMADQIAASGRYVLYVTLTVLAISSMNRQNYLSPVDFESFKESGGIEYTADVIWGLQLSILSDDDFYFKVGKDNKRRETNLKEKREMVKRAKAACPRCIDLVCLKNRYGISSYEVPFWYYPSVDYFGPVYNPSDLDTIDDYKL